RVKRSCTEIAEARGGGSPVAFRAVHELPRAACGESFESRVQWSRRKQARLQIALHTTRAQPCTRRAPHDGSDSASLAAVGLESRTHPSQGFVAIDQFRLAFPDLIDAAVSLGGPSLLPLLLREPFVALVVERSK